MNLYIISGGSKGLGKALVTLLKQSDNLVYSISRTQTDSGHISCDLSDPNSIDEKLLEFFQEIDFQKLVSATLINNAGTLDPIGTVSEFESEAVLKNLNVNFNAAILISRLFLKHTQDLDIPKQIFNISSGAAVKPYAGWSLYCAAKAGLEHFGRSVAEEQKQKTFPVSVININPGVMDTDMQATIRSTDQIKFPTIQRFLDLKSNGDLQSPETVAKLIIKGVESHKLETGKTVGLSELAAL